MSDFCCYFRCDFYGDFMATQYRVLILLIYANFNRFHFKLENDLRGVETSFFIVSFYLKKLFKETAFKYKRAQISRSVLTVDI